MNIRFCMWTVFYREKQSFATETREPQQVWYRVRGHLYVSGKRIDSLLILLLV